MPPEPIWRSITYRPSNSWPMREKALTKPLLCHVAVEVRLDHLRGDGRRDLAAELGRLLDDDRDGDLRVVGGRECDEPGGVQTVHAGLGRARLAGHVQAEHVGRRA